jgi:hypothetical protein
MAVINDPNTPANGLSIDSFGSSLTRLVDGSGNVITRTNADAPSTIGGLVTMGLNDASVYALRADRIGSQMVGSHNLEMWDPFEGTTIHANRWLITNTTMTGAQATASGITFNASAITTINTGYMLQSAKKLIKKIKAPLHLRFRARLNMVSNAIAELGIGDAATFNGANSNGIYFQVTSGAVLQPVLTFNGVDRTGTAIAYNTANYYIFDIVIDDDTVLFTVQDSSTGLLISRQVMFLPLSQARMLANTGISMLARLYNSGSAPASASTMVLSECYALSLDFAKNKPYAHQKASLQRSSLSNLQSGAQLHTWTNSAEPASATLSNTAAGYSTLGGKFQFAAVAGAATDFALFALQLPSQTNFYCTGITIDVWNTGAASATTPTLLEWAIGVGSTAVSLATATVMRIPIGAQSMPVGTAIGANLTQINKQFQTPVVCEGNRFFHIILRMPVGTATASQVIAGMVGIEGYFD